MTKSRIQPPIVVLTLMHDCCCCCFQECSHLEQKQQAPCSPSHICISSCSLCSAPSQCLKVFVNMPTCQPSILLWLCRLQPSYLPVVRFANGREILLQPERISQEYPDLGICSRVQVCSNCECQPCMHDLTELSHLSNRASLFTSCCMSGTQDHGCICMQISVH